MAFGGFERGTAPSQPMAEINVTPLVDVMLVLLVIFIITAPLLAYAIKLDLPEVKAAPSASRSDTIKLSLDAAGKFHWNEEQVSEAEALQRLAEAGKKQPQPELHLRADKNTRYEMLARLMSAAQQAGLTRIGFVTEPEAGKRDDRQNDGPNDRQSSPPDAPPSDSKQPSPKPPAAKK